MVRRAVSLCRFLREGVTACFKLTPDAYLEFLELCLKDLEEELRDVRREVS